MNNIIKHLKMLIAGVMFIVTSQVYAQPANLVLQDTTIANVVTFTARNSITAGPNFTIASSGDATFVTGGYIYFRPEIVIIQGAKFQAVIDTTLVDVKMDEDPIPMEFSLRQNYPNPFNPTTRIEFKIADLGSVTLKVYDVLGNEVMTLVNEEKPAGVYEVEFNASSITSGVYFYRLQAGSFVETKKMILMK